MFSASPRGEDRAAPIAPRAVPSRAPGNLAALFLLLFAGVAALSIDIVRTGLMLTIHAPQPNVERFLGVDVKVLGVRAP